MSRRLILVDTFEDDYDNDDDDFEEQDEYEDDFDDLEDDDDDEQHQQQDEQQLVLAALLRRVRSTNTTHTAKRKRKRKRKRVAKASTHARKRAAVNDDAGANARAAVAARLARVRSSSSSSSSSTQAQATPKSKPTKRLRKLQQPVVAPGVLERLRATTALHKLAHTSPNQLGSPLHSPTTRKHIHQAFHRRHLLQRLQHARTQRLTHAWLHDGPADIGSTAHGILAEMALRRDAAPSSSPSSTLQPLLPNDQRPVDRADLKEQLIQSLLERGIHDETLVRAAMGGHTALDRILILAGDDCVEE